MAASEWFVWHQNARAFVAGQEVVKRDPESTKNAIEECRFVSSTPVHSTLEKLSETLGSGRPFYVASEELAIDPQSTKGRFFTLTSGSTSKPKVIARSQKSWLRSFQINHDLFDYTASDSIAVLGGLEHSLALYGVLEALNLGLDLHCLGNLRPDKQTALIQRGGVTILYATPTQLKLMCRHEAMPTVRLILCGGGAVDDATREAVCAYLPNAALNVFYGAAETSFITLSDATTPTGSVGKPYPGVEIDLREDGEIWVRSDLVFEGYAQGQSADTHLKDGFVSVGEIGWRDQYGNLFLRGRAGRMVNIADQTFFLDEIEAILANIAECPPTVLTPVKDAKRGSRLHAVIEGSEDFNIAAIVTKVCQDKFGPLVTPRSVHFIDALPRLASGKPNFAAIDALFEDQAT